MNRRAFMLGAGGATASCVSWAVAARAQQPERMRRIGVLMAANADDPEYQARMAAFQQGLAQLGWADGRNARIDTRWATNAGDLHRHAAELVALAPDVILAASGTTTVAPLLQATRTAALASEASGLRGDSKIRAHSASEDARGRAGDTRPEPGSSARAVPIVFVIVIDPVGAGFVSSLARPGGNATGFLMFEYGLAGKWLELLKQIAPGVTRAAVLRDPAIASGIGQFGAIQTAAPSLRIETTPVNVRDAGEIERDIDAFARSANGGMIVTASPEASLHRGLIVALAARHRLPTVYASRYYVADGGLICYGPDIIDQFRRAAGYVDRVLRGEKPADLPVQAPTRYELVINLKTAKALGLTVPDTLLASADEVIE
jgi:putative ABC transport system substrate-binding protein